MLGGVADYKLLRFQSSPARGGGCNITNDSQRLQILQFQSSPARGGGCNLNELDERVYNTRVSILTRPWGRVQPAMLVLPDVSGSMFQSSPARGGGCNRRIARALQTRHAVSILTRPWGRVQRGLENARERFPKRKCSSCQGVPCRALGG